MNKISIIFLFAIFGLSLNAATFISVTAGSYDDPLTWGGSLGDPTPNTSDDVIVGHDVTVVSTSRANDLTILSGATFSQTTGNLTVYGTFTVSTGAIHFIGTRVLRLNGDVILNGNLDGTSGRMYLNTAGDLSGSGNLNYTGRLFINRTMDIVAGSNITKLEGQVRPGATAAVSNYGTITIDNLASTAGSSWINNTNSSFTIGGAITGDLSLNASASGNTVLYIRIGTSNQNIITPILGRYYNLTIDGDDLGSKKNLTGDINILGDLYIEGSTLRAGTTTSYDIDLKGNWYNNGGEFDPSQGFVSFNGSSDQELDNFSGVETFFDLYLSGGGLLSLYADLDIARDINIDKDMDTFGQSINVGGSWTAPDNFDLQGSVITFDENYDGTITGDIAFEDLTIDKTLATSTITIEAATTVSIGGTLDVLLGILATNDNLLILSDASGTGRIGDLSNGTISGDVEVQRFFDYVNNGWHLMCAPVQGATLEDWDDDVITTGFVGADYPSFEFNNATYYDEVAAGADRDAGLMNAVNSTESTSNLSGWRMYLAAGATTLDVKGPIFSGLQTIPVSYNGDGAPLEDGWNLISNPFVSTIDWDAASGWSKSGLNDAVYVWDPVTEQYTTYVAGVGTNGGSQFIPSTQAFWVQSFMAPSLSIDEPVKVTNDTQFRNNKALNSFFRIAISNGQGMKSDVGVRLDDRATDGFDRNLDAYFLKSSNELIPSISIVDENDLAYSIYSITELNEERIIPITVSVGASQNFEFSFENLDRFQKASCLSLVDSETGEIHPMMEGAAVSKFLEAGDYSDRFFIKLNAPISAKVINDNCVASENEIQVVLPNGTNWNVRGYDESNNIAFEQFAVEGMVESDFLPSGNYSVEIISEDGSCLNSLSQVNIPSSHTPNITFETIGATNGNSNGMVNTTVEGALPPFQYTWSDGSTNEDLENVVADTYFLTITDSRQCAYSTSVFVDGSGDDSVSEVKSLEGNDVSIIQNGDNLIVNFDLEKKQNYFISVYNAIGQVIFEDEVDGVQIEKISIPSDGFQGVVLIVLQNKKSNEKIVQRFVM